VWNSHTGLTGSLLDVCEVSQAVEHGEIEVEDYSNNQMSLRFLAGALSIPFIPSRSGFATDLVNKEGFFG